MKAAAVKFILVHLFAVRQESRTLPVHKQLHYRSKAVHVQGTLYVRCWYMYVQREMTADTIYCTKFCKSHHHTLVVKISP